MTRQRTKLFPALAALLLAALGLGAPPGALASPGTATASTPDASGARGVPGLAEAPGMAQSAATSAAPAASVDTDPEPDSIPAVRRLLTPADYGRFESLGAVSFSPAARWVGAAVSRFDADGEVRLLSTASGGAVPAERVIERATRVDFAEGERWAAVVTGPGIEERRRMESSRTPARNDVLLVDLTAGESADQVVSEISSFAFSPDGRWILLRRYSPANGNRTSGGVDVLVRELSTGTVTNFGNVSEAAWADDGAVLAMIVDAEGKAGNGVRLFEPATGRIRTLHAEEARFRGLAWRDDSTDLALFRVDPDTVRGDTLHAVFAWKEAGGDDPQAVRLEGELRVDGDDRVFGVSDLRGLRWAENGERLFVALRPRDPAPEDDADATDEEEAAPDAEIDEDAPPGPTRPSRAEGARGAATDSVPGVEIWHARDVDPVPQQRLRVDLERRRSALAAWDLRSNSSPVLLGGDGAGESISLLPGEERAIVLDDEPWGTDRMFGPIYRDVHVVDVASGARTEVRERVEFYQQASPTGRYLLFWEADAYHVHDLETGESRNLTAGIEARFTNEQVDVVVPQKPPYGNGGWTEDDEHVLLYDRFDVWRVRPDGSGAERLTSGAEDEVRHRLVRLDPDQDAWPAEGPWTVSLFGERTKRSGWGTLTPESGVERALFDDRGFQRLVRSEDGSRHLWVSQRYDDPPTLHLGNGELEGARVLSRVNAFVEDEFLWGRSELVDFENEWGVPLQAVLHYPANFEPGRQYPMVVYHYERLSQGLHNWVNPSDRSAYNTTVFTQNGYFVLQPDIVYRPRNPGLSAMATFEPALDAAIATGHIDPDRIGILGHSWGGYQTTFAVTQTDRFAAAVAGAPLTNLISMYLSFYWNSGSTDARIFEISQGRMEVPWWEDYESYVANSPVHHIERMNTPLLMAFGTDDGAVEFNQGVEFYNAARRAGKDFVLLVYEGENHSLQRRPNQLDYHRRTLEWFGHYLKGGEAPAWITEGVRFVDQQEKLRQGPAAGRAPGAGAR
jgi:dipeptidyl aminopeptidase/acylaminoacyl peptidase